MCSVVIFYAYPLHRLTCNIVKYICNRFAFIRPLSGLLISWFFLNDWILHGLGGRLTFSGCVPADVPIHYVPTYIHSLIHLMRSMLCLGTSAPRHTALNLLMLLCSEYAATNLLLDLMWYMEGLLTIVLLILLNLCRCSIKNWGVNYRLRYLRTDTVVVSQGNSVGTLLKYGNNKSTVYCDGSWGTLIACYPKKIRSQTESKSYDVQQVD